MAGSREALFAIAQAILDPAVGKLDKDQIIDLAQRKGMNLAEAERWLGPWLNYNP